MHACMQQALTRLSGWRRLGDGLEAQLEKLEISDTCNNVMYMERDKAKRKGKEKRQTDRQTDRGKERKSRLVTFLVSPHQKLVAHDFEKEGGVCGEVVHDRTQLRDEAADRIINTRVQACMHAWYSHHLIFHVLTTMTLVTHQHQKFVPKNADIQAA